MRTFLIVMLVGSLSVGLMGAANAADLREERVYFTCTGDTKAQNASALQGVVPGWDTTPPEQSVTDGAGCGFYDNLVVSSSEMPDENFRPTWEGTFVGNLDSLTVEAHNIYAGAARATSEFGLGVFLSIDGEHVFSDGFVVEPVPSSTGLSESIRFSITDLGVLGDEGTGSTEHTIRLQLTSSEEEQSIWVWDTTEVPAGITFNPATPEDVALSAAGR